MNYMIFAAMIGLDSFSLLLFLLMIGFQFLIVAVFGFMFKKVAKNSKNKSHIAVPYVSTGVGYILIIVLKYSLPNDVGQEFAPILISLVFYGGIVFILYFAVKAILKWYYARKYQITDYNK